MPVADKVRGLQQRKVRQQSQRLRIPEDQPRRKRVGEENGDDGVSRQRSDDVRLPLLDGSKRRSGEPIVRWVGFHHSLLCPLQRASQVLFQACLLPRALRYAL
ncbi:hypothetical protein ACFX2I_011392 [Malus domestica]